MHYGESLNACCPADKEKRPQTPTRQGMGEFFVFHGAAPKWPSFNGRDPAAPEGIKGKEKPVIIGFYPSLFLYLFLFFWYNMC